MEYSPNDAAFQQELKQTEALLNKASKAADKKMAGFLAGNKKVQKGDGLFDDSLRPSNEAKPKPPAEPMKLSDGLFVMPGVDAAKTEEDEEAEKERRALAKDDQVDYEELSREINEMREENPQEYQRL